MEEGSTTPVLPEDCLRTILLLLPILERVKLRGVCKTWRDVCDDCWRVAKSLSVSLNCDSSSTNTTVYGNAKHIRLITKTAPIAVTVAQYCAPYVKKFVCYYDTSDTLLQSLEESRNIEHLYLDFHTRSQDEQLGEILTANRHLKYFSVKVSKDQTCLGQLSTDCLETLIVDVKLEDTNELDYELDDQFRQLLQNIADNAKKLRKLHLIHVNGRNFPTVSSCAGLVDLTVTQRAFDFMGSVEDNFSEMAVSSIAQLSKLRKLTLANFPEALINDDFFMDLSNNCVELESISLLSCFEVTDRGAGALSSLRHLRCLTMSCVPRVTKNSLIHLKDLAELTIEYACLTNEDVVELLHECSSLYYLNLYGGDFEMSELRVLIAEVLEDRRSSTLLNLIIEGEWIVDMGVMLPDYC